MARLTERPAEWDSCTSLEWASEWLAHYELWQVTDRWHGGGHEQPAPEEDR